MNNKSTLITTALEETWDSSSNIVFLGEWCKLYSNKDILKDINHQTIPYHWSETGKLESDYLYLKELYEDLLRELSVNLNKLHKTNHSLRYWRILIGPWLYYFLHAIFDRWESVLSAKSMEDIDFAITIDCHSSKIISNDFSQFAKFLRSDYWNSYIFGLIISRYTNINVNKINIADIETVLPRPSINQISGSRRILYNILNIIVGLPLYLIGKFIAILSGEYAVKNKAFLLNTYLPKITEFAIQSFSGVIYFYKKIEFSPKKVSINTSMRKDLSTFSSGTDFEIFIRSIIPLHLPKVYLEAYSELVKTANLIYPKNIDLIWTSNSMYGNDFFKSWVANKVECNSKFYIGQHGGVYGLTKINSAQDHELSISDKYISWGWGAHRDDIVALGNFKKKRKIYFPYKRKNLLLVTANHPRYCTKIQSTPLSSQMLSEYDNHMLFYKNLSFDIRQKTIVRNDIREADWEVNSRWIDNFTNISIDYHSSSLELMASKSRCVVVAYNSTSYMEMFNSDVPTIIFWDSSTWQLTNSAFKNFSKLKKAGVFHTTPNSAAAHVNHIWGDELSWWKSDLVQSAVADFNNNYNKKVSNVVVSSLRVIANS